MLRFGVIRFTGWNFWILISFESLSSYFLRDFFSGSLNLFAIPFNLRWEGGVVIWLIAKDSQNILKSFNVNSVALSKNTGFNSAEPNEQFVQKFTSTVDIVFLHHSTFSHFIKLSTTVRQYNPFIGLRKWTCNLAYGLSVAAQLLNFIDGALATREHFLHDLTISFYVLIHIWPVRIATHRGFQMRNSRKSHKEII